MKKIIAAALALAFLTALTGASASEAGTATDPLITRSYIDGTYSDSVIKAGIEVIEGRLEAFRQLVASDPYAGLKIQRTDGWELFASQPGYSMTLITGASFMLTFGEAEVDIISGQVIDVSTGEIVESGSTLRELARYFCAEDTVASFRSVDGIAFMVEGGYSPDSGTSRQYQDYTDVLGLEWYTDPARYVRISGLYHDFESETFRPNEGISRAELVYAIWVACGRPESEYEPAFNDLLEDWYVPAVRWATEKGVTTGMDEITFAPEGGVNREQMAAMLYRCAVAMGEDVSLRTDLTVYSDWEQINDWGAEPISWATAEGYINGMDDGTVSPWGGATRAQAAAVIMRYVTLHGSEPEGPDEEGETHDAPDAPPAEGGTPSLS